MTRQASASNPWFEGSIAYEFGSECHVVIGAETSLRRHGTGFGEIVSLWTNRRALSSLTFHELRRTYAGTAGGILWTFLSPLIPIVIFSAVFAFALKLPLGGAPYVFGFTAAYVPWALLSSSISGATGSIVEHRYLVKRIVFPVEIIPADAVLVHSLPHAFLLTLASVACLIAGYGRFPNLLLVLYFYLCYIVSGYRHALMPNVFPGPTAFESAAFWIMSLGMLMIGATCFRRLRVYFWDCL